MSKKSLTPEQKKERNEKALVICLGLLVVILAVFGINAYNKNDTPAVSTAPVTASQATTVLTTTLQPSSLPVTEAPTTAVQPSLQPSVQAQSADSTEEILKAITDGINSLKANDASFTGTKTQDISVVLTTCSVPSLTGLVNKVIELFTGEESYTFDFTNGSATDPEENEPISSNAAIPPTEKPFSLTKDGVASAEKKQDGENTVYTVVVVGEKSTLSNPRPPHHNAAGDTLDLSELDFPVGEITKADFEYPGATVSITVDKNGKVIKYHERLEMKGSGEGNALGITASGEMEGYIDETWDIQWK